MDGMVEIQENPGFVSRVLDFFTRTSQYEEQSEMTADNSANGGLHIRANYSYSITVRRQITAFEDAMAAANGLKRGDQQILNLSATDVVTRQKIVDFMCGVNYAQEGTWEEIGENVYLIVPSNAYVDVAPPTPRMSALRN